MLKVRWNSEEHFVKINEKIEYHTCAAQEKQSTDFKSLLLELKLCRLSVKCQKNS